MERIGLFYDSDTGTTKRAAKAVKAHFDDLEMTAPIPAETATAEEVLGFRHLVFGLPTIGIGNMPAGWTRLLARLEDADLSGRTVALFGLGDQLCYGDSYVDAMGDLADFLASRGAKLVGAWPAEGYECAASRARRNGSFVGLALDEDNQPDRTPDRIAAWAAALRREFGLPDRA
ncbi:flavodoxin [Oleispirillum naphthae]|uniref:flavodoxin n=1 Tax=Oleispirillum naphthae TaxID=2838853 RepID=UPI003082566F